MKIPWAQYYMRIAQTVSERSSCIKRQVGAVIVVKERIVSTGYNGTPQGILDCNQGGCVRCNDSSIPSGTRLDECWCCHAEENAIVSAARFGASISGGTLYTTLSPCIWCSKMAINSEIALIRFAGNYPQTGAPLLKEAGIRIENISLLRDNKE